MIVHEHNSQMFDLEVVWQTATADIKYFADKIALIVDNG
ncbi:MAG: hypothetical protein IJI66_15025 [Erysipelotrichaceae bacterium]|nr:hypothetical protein [Erysipelotrichaceae bacterium]